VRLVLDTSVLVAAIRSSSGASNQLVQAALERRFTLLLSVPLVVEYEAVMTREEHLLSSGLSSSEVSVLLDALVAVSVPVRLNFLWRPTLRDPDDDMVLEAAANGRADAVVTFNVKDFSVARERFGLEVLSPGRAYERVKRL
jgi:putative PIN family toxin of toxin-antitoxin system